MKKNIFNLENTNRQSNKISIESLSDKIIANKIITSPDTKKPHPDDDRAFTLKSHLIEEILLSKLNLTIYAIKMENGEEIFIDSAKKIATIIDFYKKNNFRLSNLNVLKCLNGQRFSDLPKKTQQKISSYKIHIFHIDKDSSIDIKFQFFESYLKNITKNYSNS